MSFLKRLTKVMHTSTSNHLSSYQPSQWAKWFANDRRFHAFDLDQEMLLLTDKFQKKHQHHVLSIQLDIDIESGWFWDTLLISQIDGQTLRFGGVGKKQSALLQVSMKRHVNQRIQRFYQEFAPVLIQAAQEARLIFSGQRYIRRAMAAHWFRHNAALAVGLKRPDGLQYLPGALHQDYQNVRPLIDNMDEQISCFNQAFIDRQAQLFRDFFDQVETNPLTEAQRKACIIEEQHNLVLAGAGTGKTSIMIGRAIDYVESGRFSSPYRYLLVDEFQDISASRARLLKAFSPPYPSSKPTRI